MAMIKKLSVSGIRSFDPDEHESIIFKRPLTLILGENGCGKTTIIESLKFALCGELPPNSNNGQSFVHDPKMNRSREVKGQIRLQFVSANGTQYLVVKSVLSQMTQKKLSFKRIDSALKIVDNPSKPVEISGRCGEIDATLASILGVSTAILNNVIFCHQDESNWPLEGGKKLKERFDAIFDATKYNKCFESIRKLRKEYGVRVKLLEQEVQFMSERKQEYDGKRLRISKHEDKIAQEKTKSGELLLQIAPIKERLKEINKLENNIVKIKTDRERTNASLKICKNQQEHLNKTIKSFYTGTDEELEEDIVSFTSNLQKKEKEMLEAEKKLANTKKMDIETAKKISSQEIKKSELFTLEGQNQEKISSRNDQLIKASEFAEIEVPESVDDENEATKLFEKIDRKRKALAKDLIELKKTFDAEAKDMQKIVDSCRDASARHKQKIISKRQECNQFNMKLDELRREISAANESKNKLDFIEQKLAESDNKLQRIMSECDVDALQESINNNDSTVSELDKDLEELSEMITKMQTQHAKLTEISLQKEALAAKQKIATKFKNKNRDNMVEILGSKLPVNNFKSAFQNCQFDLKNEAEQLNKTLKTKQHEITSLESKRIHQKEELLKKKNELSSAEEQLYNRCGKLTLEEKLGKLDAEMETLQDKKIDISSSEFVIKKYVDKIKQEKSCPLCHRDFDCQQDATDLVSELNEKARNIPKNLDSILENLSRQTKTRDELVALRPLDKKIKCLKNEEIPSLENSLDNTEKKLQETRDEVEELSMSVSEPERKLQCIAAMLPDMSLLDQALQEIATINVEISKLESQIHSNDFNMNLEESLSKQGKMRQEANRLRATIKTNQSKLNKHNEKLQAAREEKNKLKEESLKIQTKIQKLCTLQTQLTTTERDKEKAELDLASLIESSNLLENELENSDKKKKTVVEKNGNQYEKEQKKLNEFDKLLSTIVNYNKEISEHESKDIRGQLDKLKTTLSELNEKKDKLTSEIQSLSTIVEKIKDETSNQQLNKRDLDDNLTLRKHKTEQQKLQMEMRKIEENIGELNEDTLAAEKEKLIETQNDAILGRVKLEGDIKNLQEMVKEAMNELQQPQYKHIHENYKKKFSELILLKAADKDLKDYSVSMDVCLMKFHKEKMTKINNIIRDMWRNIYRGNDIDYIEIKTDENEGNAGGTKRMYDYRVVQRRNDTEIDMAGRCSAGQKVLASLIIRMALAETFSNRFGILALDEPTTNLDRENITSLCNALGEMVLTRMKQNNFMFIIITHDAEFLQSLGRVDKLTHFYRVTRNREGKSKINRESMN